MATLDMDVPSLLNCSTYCEERLRTFHRQGAYADITRLQNAFTSEDLQLASNMILPVLARTPCSLLSFPNLHKKHVNLH